MVRKRGENEPETARFPKGEEHGGGTMRFGWVQRKELSRIVGHVESQERLQHGVAAIR